MFHHLVYISFRDTTGGRHVQHDEKGHGGTTDAACLPACLRAGRFMKFSSRRRGRVDSAINNVSPRRHACERWRYRCKCTLPHLLLTRIYMWPRARACFRERRVFATTSSPFKHREHLEHVRNRVRFMYLSWNDGNRVAKCFSDTSPWISLQSEK